MGAVIQGPWKKRTTRQIIEHEMLIVAQSLGGETDATDEPPRWPPARAAIHAVLPAGEPQRQ